MTPPISNRANQYAINIPFENYGKTSLLVLAIDKHHYWVPVRHVIKDGINEVAQTEIKERYSPTALTDREWIEPGDQDMFSIFVEITPTEREEMDSLKTGLAFFGCLKYIDIWNEVHWKDFCRVKTVLSQPAGNCHYKCLGESDLPSDIDKDTKSQP